MSDHTAAVAPSDNRQNASSDGPLLWNPDVAAVLSWLFFTSAFGAAVHAANWRRLGQPKRMWSSIAWVAVVPLLYMAAAVYGASNAGLGVVNLLNLVAWYFVSGRRQSKYVVFELQNQYRHDSWVVPILAALSLLLLPGVIFYFA